MATHLIGLMGKKRSGKDTFAQRLVEQHGFTRLAFADALKDVLLDLNPIVDRGITREVRLVEIVAALGMDGAKELPEVRKLLQRLGVAVRDHVKDSAWVDLVLRKATEIQGPVVITDVRFPNEGDLVMQQWGCLVRIERPGLVSTDTHVSETLMDTYPASVTIQNNAGIEELHAAADAFVGWLNTPSRHMIGAAA